MRKFILTALVLTLLCGNALAQSPLLRAGSAFLLSAVPGPTGTIELKWKIAPGYYLYRDHISVTDSASGAIIGLDLPTGEVKTTLGVGSAVVYYDQVSILAAVVVGKLKVTYQGCRESSICYPPITKIVDAHSFAIVDSEDEHAESRQFRPDYKREVNRYLDGVENNVDHIAFDFDAAESRATDFNSVKDHYAYLPYGETQCEVQAGGQEIRRLFVRDWQVLKLDLRHRRNGRLRTWSHHNEYADDGTEDDGSRLRV